VFNHAHVLTYSPSPTPGGAARHAGQGHGKGFRSTTFHEYVQESFERTRRTDQSREHILVTMSTGTIFNQPKAAVRLPNDLIEAINKAAEPFPIPEGKEYGYGTAGVRETLPSAITDY
jgi:hypothetical protein